MCMKAYHCCLKFLWNDKPHLISYKVIINKCQKGGLNFPEIFQKMFASRMKFLSRLLDESYVAFWKSTCLYFFFFQSRGNEILFCKIPMMNLTCLPEFNQIMLWYTLQENINIDVDKIVCFIFPYFLAQK